jgi:hypothetical protein
LTFKFVAAVCCLQSLHMLLVPELYGLTRGTPEFNAFAEELLREARLLHSLRHENIVLLRGVAMHPEHGHVQWLVTEQATGGSLEAWVSARGRLTLAELLDLLRSVMRALVYLHSRDPVVIHRDIKPANVLVFTSFGGGITWKPCGHYSLHGARRAARSVRRQGGRVQHGHHGRGARRAVHGHRRLRARDLGAVQSAGAPPCAG